jgi:hypothetical protein
MNSNSAQTEKTGFFFIIGNGRSGTTLLRTLFDAHPQVNIPLECQLIINLSKKFAKVKFWDAALINDFITEIYKQRRFSEWKISKNTLKENLAICIGANSFSTIIKAVYLSYSSNFNKNEIKLIGDKTIINALYIKQLIMLFPDAKFIHITRDYRDRNLSLTGKKLTSSSIALKTMQWKYTQQKILKVITNFPDRIYTIRYEDFVNEPRMHFEKICKFLKINYYSSVFEYYLDEKIPEKIYKKEFIDSWQNNLFKPINTNRSGIWKTEMSEYQIEISDYIAGEIAEIYGYERVYKKSNLKIKLAIFPYSVLHNLVIYRRNIVDKLPFRLRNYFMGRSLLLLLYDKAFGIKR